MKTMTTCLKHQLFIRLVQCVAMRFLRFHYFERESNPMGRLNLDSIVHSPMIGMGCQLLLVLILLAAIVGKRRETKNCFRSQIANRMIVFGCSRFLR